MSTLSIALFCGGRLESESHLLREVAFLTESISQPHDICQGHSPEIVLWSLQPKQSSGFRDGIATPEEVGKRGLEVGYGVCGVALKIHPAFNPLLFID
ncbi:hypothetical protein HID58_074401 [Brassica napus]|uniref:Uncharacterized protein n=1 Tax=Brassica napus TaxID=3708 RepID=A0ABQ7YGP3_BRANA|nr:hypothetical protein HID58_074401 [Brassica napus]